MALENITWIFFDIGSTLVDETKAFQHRIEDSIAGTDITYEQFYDTMLSYYRQNKKGDSETIKVLGLFYPKWHSEDEFLYPRAKECLGSLKPRYKIGIIANQPLGTNDRLKKFGIFEDIDLVISSAEEGASKPDVKIFEIALERAGCPPQNAVMIGDRLDNDIVPANALGMKTVWIRQGFCRFFTPRTALEKADHTVDNLCGVKKLFSR